MMGDSMGNIRDMSSNIANELDEQVCIYIYMYIIYIYQSTFYLLSFIFYHLSHDGVNPESFRHIQTLTLKYSLLYISIKKWQRSSKKKILDKHAEAQPYMEKPGDPVIRSPIETQFLGGDGQNYVKMLKYWGGRLTNCKNA